MKDENTIKNANKVIKQIYSKILEDDNKVTPEQILEDEFDKYFIFEVFFRQYFMKYKSNTKSAKEELIYELVDTIIYNDGNVSIDELVDIATLNVVPKTDKKTRLLEVEPLTLTVQINDSFVELTDNMSEKEKEEKISELFSSDEDEEDIVEVKKKKKELKKDGTKRNKEKKFFFK